MIKRYLATPQRRYQKKQKDAGNFEINNPLAQKLLKRIQRGSEIVRGEKLPDGKERMLFRNVLPIIIVLLIVPVSSASATDWSNPKIPDPMAQALREKGKISFVDSRIDAIIYYPRETLGPEEPKPNLVFALKDGAIVGRAVVLDGQRLASVAIGRLTHQEAAAVLIDLANKLGPRTGFTQSFSDFVEENHFDRALFLILILMVIIAAVCEAHDSGGDKPNPDDNSNTPDLPAAPNPPVITNTEDSDMKDEIQKYEAGALEQIRPELTRFGAENPFLELAPVPKHSHEFQGWIREAIKRGNIKSHLMTEELQTRLAAQLNSFYEQILAITQKHNQIRRESIIPEIELHTQAAEKLYALRRVPLKAKVDDLKVETELANARAELAKARKQMAIDLEKLDAQIITFDKPKDTSHDDREATRLQQEIDNISRKVSTIAGLEQACADMKARSPQHLWPIMDRLFRKVIDTKKESL